MCILQGEGEKSRKNYVRQQSINWMASRKGEGRRHFYMKNMPDKKHEANTEAHLQKKRKGPERQTHYTDVTRSIVLLTADIRNKAQCWAGTSHKCDI